MGTLADAGAALWGTAGEYAYETYSHLRARLYQELPSELPIVIGLCAYGHCLGLTRSSLQHGPRITLASSLFAEGTGHVDDTLTHEMLHVLLFLRHENPAHNGGPWYREIRRLSPTVLGHELDVVRGSDRRSLRVPGVGVRKERVPGAIAHKDVARWPRSFRPADHDWGNPIDCPSY
ncbi:MAG: hypothetical protein QOH66_2139 [Actinomycetota bacterium]|nr:hypothetical protein [Actinomycetota bacterium]